MLLKIWRKISFGALYCAIIYIVQNILSTVFSFMISGLIIYRILRYVYFIIGCAVVIIASYNFRLKRSDLRKKYLSETADNDTDIPEILYMIPSGELLIELALALAAFAVRNIVSRSFIFFVLEMLFFVVADIAVWVAVHREWDVDRVSGDWE